MIDILKVIIIGIVEGITEWLPISSTGHMILVDEFINLNMSNEFKEVFLVVIQLGAIAAVGVIFFKKLNPFIQDQQKRRDVLNTWLKIIIASIPAAVFGLLLDDWLNDTLYNYITVAVMLVVYGIVFIVVETFLKGKQPTVTSLSHLTYRTAFMIGMFQVLSLIPGTSRSGATIIGGLVLGTSRFVAAEFSFFLSIPVMVGASLLKIMKFGLDFTTLELSMLGIGMVVAFTTSIVAIRFLIAYIKQHDFKVFGYYRIVLGVIVVIYFLIN